MVVMAAGKEMKKGTGKGGEILGGLSWSMAVWNASIDFKANRKSLNRQNQQITVKPVTIFGRFKVTLSIVITLNHEYNSMCRKKKHFLFQ